MSHANTSSQFWAKKEEVKEEDGTVPEEWLEADIKQGISNSDVENRRKRFGWNELSSEKENLFIKFLMFFTGPILYGKSPPACRALPAALQHALWLQWLDLSRCFCFLRAPSGKLSELRAQKAWRTWAAAAIVAT